MLWLIEALTKGRGGFFAARELLKDERWENPFDA
jgi:hypothetical protein